MGFYFETYEFRIFAHGLQTGRRFSDFATWTFKENGTERGDFGTLKT